MSDGVPGDLAEWAATDAAMSHAAVRDGALSRVLFRNGYDTIEIARLMHRDEAEIVELLHAEDDL